VVGLHRRRRLMLVQTEGPWDRPGTLYFWRGPLSMFAGTPGLQLPAAWYGHPDPAPLVDVPTGEHWFHAVKTTNPDDFAWVMAAPNAKSAKRRGSREGEHGRRITLRPGWDDGISQAVMLAANRGKFLLEPFRSYLLLTGATPLAEDSPHDDRWGCRDRSGGFTGLNWLGLTLMQVRAELPSLHAAQLERLHITTTPRGTRRAA